MKRVAMIVTLLSMLLFGALIAEADTSDYYEITDSDFYYDCIDGVNYAFGYFVITNTGDDILCLYNPYIEVRDPEGNLFSIINSTVVMSRLYISPGQISHVYSIEGIKLGDKFNLTDYEINLNISVTTSNEAPHEAVMYDDEILANNYQTRFFIHGTYRNPRLADITCLITVYLEGEDGKCRGLTTRYQNVKSGAEASFDIEVTDYLNMYGYSGMIYYDAIIQEVLTGQ